MSYSHRDREWLNRLSVLLSPTVRNGRLEVWADPYIQIGDRWEREITAAVSRSFLAVLLVSADFLNSPFIIDEELPALVAAGVRLAPVLVHDCLWSEEPLLAQVQWVSVGEGGDEVSVARSIADQRTFHRVPVAVCYAMLGLSVGWFYKWIKAPVTGQVAPAA